MPFIALDPSLAAAAPVVTSGAPLISTGETLQTIREELIQELASRTDIAPAGDNTRVNKVINWAYLHVCSMIDLTELHADLELAVVADQPLYALPLQVAVAKRLSIQDADNYPEGGRLLEKIDYKAYRRLDDYTTGEPRSWFRYSRMAVIHPTPINDRTAVLGYKIRPDRLAADNHSPLLPEEFHEAILLAAKSRVERLFRMFTASRATWNDMLMILRPIINTDAEEAGTQDARVYAPRTVRDYYRGRR